MNPYRDSVVAVAAPRRPRKRLTTQRKNFGIVLAAVAPNAVPLAAAQWGWPCGLAVCGFGVLVGIVIAFVGRSRSPFARLCALTWNRGDRLGAALLRFGVIEPRYSAKRIAKNAAALATAQVGMPKHRGF